SPTAMTTRRRQARPTSSTSPDRCRSRRSTRRWDGPPQTTAVPDLRLLEVLVGRPVGRGAGRTGRRAGGVIAAALRAKKGRDCSRLFLDGGRLRRVLVVHTLASNWTADDDPVFASLAMNPACSRAH